MRKAQRGVTMIGWLFLLAPMAVVGYAAVRLIPVYLNYMNIARSMAQLAEEMGGDESATAVRSSLEKRLDIQGVSYPDVKDFGVRRDGQKWIVDVHYEDPVPLFANLKLLVTFEKTVELQ